MVALPVGQLIFIRARDDHIAQANVLLVIGVMWNAASHADNEHVVDFLECAQQSGHCVAGRCHRLARTTDRRQFCADDAMGADVAQCVHVRFTWKFASFR